MVLPPCRFHDDQAESITMDEQTVRTVRKTFKYKLQPTAEQERTLACKSAATPGRSAA
jgi:hypothetical protein